MKFFAVLSFLLAAVSALPSSRIFNGNPAARGQFPYQAHLNLTTTKGNFICSGAIVSRRWVVTAGNCIVGAKNATVIVGSNALIGEDLKRVTSNATKFVLHDKYDSKDSRNNIGLVQTVNNLYYLSGPTVGAIALPRSDVADGAAVVVSGWGVTRDRGELTSYLMFTSLQVISNKQCTSVYTDIIINSNIVCTTSNSSTVRGICSGDIGAPLVANGSTKAVLVGLGIIYTSRERGCERGEPSGFTRVFPFVSWIKEVAGL